ncbi:MAG: hypothetical protein J1E98_12850 [Lachnospiraceae bacterium]|nr:hypothetical protein [Lachnospiraceae bacterium]
MNEMTKVTEKTETTEPAILTVPKVQRKYKDTLFHMPLRDLFYVSTVLKGRVKDENLYGQALIKIPAPRFVVLYNGTED